MAETLGKFIVTDRCNAPIIYCDGAVGLGFVNGIVTLTLAASVQSVIDGPDVEMSHQIVAHLRMNKQAAESIRNAIDKALFLGVPVENSSEGKTN